MWTWSQRSKTMNMAYWHPVQVDAHGIKDFTKFVHKHGLCFVSSFTNIVKFQDIPFLITFCWKYFLTKIYIFFSKSEHSFSTIRTLSTALLAFSFAEMMLSSSMPLKKNRSWICVVRSFISGHCEWIVPGLLSL